MVGLDLGTELDIKEKFEASKCLDKAMRPLLLDIESVSESSESCGKTPQALTRFR